MGTVLSQIASTRVLSTLKHVTKLLGQIAGLALKVPAFWVTENRPGSLHQEPEAIDQSLALWEMGKRGPNTLLPTPRPRGNIPRASVKYAPALAELSKRDLKRPDVKKPRLAGLCGGY